MNITTPSEDFTNLIPSIEEINLGLNELRSYQFISPTFETVREVFFNHVPFLSLPALAMPRTAVDGMAVYRARQLSQHDNITDVKTFGAPPPSIDVTRIGRANWPAYPVFYGGDSAHTTISELKSIGAGDELYVAKYQFDFSSLAKDYKIPIVPLLFGDLPTDNPWAELLNNNFNQTDLFRKFVPDEKAQLRENLRYLNSQLSDLFASPSREHYPITAFIAHSQMYNTIDNGILYFPLIIYPSVESHSTRCNFAIHPAFANAFLKLERVMHLIVTGLGNKIYETQIVKVGNLASDLIHWSQIQLDFNKTKFRVLKMHCEKCDFSIIGDAYKTFEFYVNGERTEAVNLVGELLNQEFRRNLAIPDEFLDNFEIPDKYEDQVVLFSGSKCYCVENGNKHFNPVFTIDIEFKLAFVDLGK